MGVVEIHKFLHEIHFFFMISPISVVEWRQLNAFHLFIFLLPAVCSTDQFTASPNEISN